MGIVSSLASRFGPAGSFGRPGWLGKLPISKSQAGPVVDADKALSTTALWAGVNRIARDTATIPCKVYREDAGGRAPYREHRLWEVLNGVRANPEMTSSEARAMLMTFVLTNGNGYAIIDSRDGMPEAIWPVPSYCVDVLRSPGGALQYWVATLDGTRALYHPDEILHLRGMTRDGILGVDTVQQLRESIGISLAAEEAAGSYFGNGAQPGGVLHTDAPLSDERYYRILNSWNERHEGATKAQKTALLDNGVKWMQVTSDPEKSQLIETRKFSVAEAARMLCIPPHKLGDLDRAIHSNIEAQEIDYWVGSLQPWLVNLEQLYMKRLLLPSERRAGITIEHKIEGRLRGDSAARAQFYTSMLQNGGMSPNEIAEAENMNAVPGGEKRLVPMNLRPVDAPFDSNEVRDKDGRPEGPQKRSGPSKGPETRADAPWEEHRGIRRRKRLEKAFERNLRNELDSYLRREVRATRRALGKEEDADAFRAWAEEFYEGEKEFIADRYQPIIHSYMQAMAGAAADEYESDTSDRSAESVDFEEEASRWARNFGIGWSTSSINQIRKILRESASYEEAREAIEALLVEWEDDRAERQAADEVVNAGSYASELTWAAAGASVIVWRANPDACPLCENMDGRRKVIRGSFAPAGSTVEKGEGSPLTSKAPVRRPPLHKGCNCTQVPG